jgi:hypothetical protein
MLFVVFVLLFPFVVFFFFSFVCAALMVGFVVVCATLVIEFYTMTYIIFATLDVGFWTLLCNQPGSLPTQFGSDPLF